MMSHVLGCRCLICGKRYATGEIDYVCPDHGDEGIVDLEYDYDAIGGQLRKEDLAGDPDRSIWRYRALLPVAPGIRVPPLAIGFTPLIPARRLARRLNLNAVWIKDDGRMPTASFKDRASALAVMKAREVHAPVITTASTGNAAAALSGVCASVGMENVIFVPQRAPKAKIAQLLMYGSKVVLVEGTYDDAFELCLKAAKKFGWYNRNTGYNPYMSEGKKTAAFEICEQLNWKSPNRIFVSVGDGCIIGGLHKGFKDLLALGWIDRMPKLMGIQAEGSAYLYEAWKNREDVVTKPPISVRTLADSIGAGLPRDRIKAMAAVRETGGEFVLVKDTEILNAMGDLARWTGVFAEPAAAAAHAGLLRVAGAGRITADETVVVINTGSGLKDIDNAMRAAELGGLECLRIAPNADALDTLASLTDGSAGGDGGLSTLQPRSNES